MKRKNKAVAFLRRNFKSKLMILAILAVLLLFFTNDFGLVDVEKTAIVVAMGVDTADGTYEVSCQVVRPTQGAADQQVVVKGTGKTVAEAVNDVQTRTGWYPKLNFCTLVALGEDVLRGNVMETLQFFLRTEQFNDSALLIATRGSAGDLLEKSTPLDAVSGYGLQKIITKDNRRISNVISVNLMDYAARYYSPTNAIVLPLVETVETGSAPAAAESEGGKQQEGGGEAKGGDVLYDATHAAVLRQGTMIGELDDRKTRAFNLLLSPHVLGYWSLDNVMEDNAAELVLDGKRVRCSADIVDGALVYTVKVRVRVRPLDVKNSGGEIGELTEAYALSPEVREKAEESIRRDVTELFEFCRESGADVFDIGDKTYKFHNRKWKRFTEGLSDKSDYLKNAVLKLAVTVVDL